MKIFDWLIMNMGTIIVGILLIVAVAMAVRSLVKIKKNGKTICSGDCANCGKCLNNELKERVGGNDCN